MKIPETLWYLYDLFLWVCAIKPWGVQRHPPNAGRDEAAPSLAPAQRLAAYRMWKLQQLTFMLGYFCSYWYPRGAGGCLWKFFPERFSFQSNAAYRSYTHWLFEPRSWLAQEGSVVSILLWGNQGIEGSRDTRLWAAGYPLTAWATLSSWLKMFATAWKYKGYWEGFRCRSFCREAEEQVVTS